MRRRLLSVVVRNDSFKLSSLFQSNVWKGPLELRKSCSTSYVLRGFSAKEEDEDDESFWLLYDSIPELKKKKSIQHDRPLSSVESEHRLLVQQQVLEKFQMGVNELLNIPLPCPDPRTAIMAIRGFMHQYHMLKNREDSHVIECASSDAFGVADGFGYSQRHSAPESPRRLG
jgi:hypothetical protein